MYEIDSNWIKASHPQVRKEKGKKKHLSFIYHACKDMADWWTLPYRTGTVPPKTLPNAVGERSLVDG